MPDPAEQLQRIYLAGFELQTFDRFPNVWAWFATAASPCWCPRWTGCKCWEPRAGAWEKPLECFWRSGGRQIFQAKQEILEATPERLEILGRFRNDLACSSPS